MEVDSTKRRRTASRRGAIQSLFGAAALLRVQSHPDDRSPRRAKPDRPRPPCPAGSAHEPYQPGPEDVPAWLRGRWAQENVYQFLRQDFGLNRLPEYGLEELDPHVDVVNPRSRQVDNLIRKLRAQLGSKQVRLCAPSRLLAGELLEGMRYQPLFSLMRYLMDSLRMLAYRAELDRASSSLRSCPSPRPRSRSSSDCQPTMRTGCRTRRRASCACACCTKPPPRGPIIWSSTTAAGRTEPDRDGLSGDQPAAGLRLTPSAARTAGPGRSHCRHRHCTAGGAPVAAAVPRVQAATAVAPFFSSARREGQPASHAPCSPALAALSDPARTPKAGHWKLAHVRNSGNTLHPAL